MGSIVNVLIFFVIVAILFNTLGESLGLHTGGVFGKFILGTGQSENDYTSFHLYDYLFVGVAGITAFAIVIGTIFPNPYTIFAVAASSMVGLFAVLPFDLFNATYSYTAADGSVLTAYYLPPPLNYLLVGVFGFIMPLLVLFWYRGGES